MEIANLFQAEENLTTKAINHAEWLSFFKEMCMRAWIWNSEYWILFFM